MDHRALAAFFAISERRFFVSDLARAIPPFKPPLRTKATAAGSLPSLGSGSLAWPVDRSTMDFASWLASRGRLGLLERLGIEVYNSIYIHLVRENDNGIKWT